MFHLCHCFFIKTLSVNIVKRQIVTNRIKDILNNNVEGRVQVNGWVRSLRKMKDLIFIDVNDGSSSKHLQVLILKSNVPDGLSYGASVKVDGVLRKNINNQIELHPDNFTLIGRCEVNKFPFAPRKTYDEDYVRQYLHLRCRTKKFSSILRLRSKVTRCIRNFLDMNNFIEIQTPVLTSNDCEGAGEVFTIEALHKTGEENNTLNEFFDIKTFLSVSGQLHLEAAARSLGDVYCLGPVFRAENSKSRLHLSEFYMLEIESAFISDISILINFLEKLFKSVCNYLLSNYKSEVTSDIENLIKDPFQIVTYKEACEILQKHEQKLQIKYSNGQSLTKEHELFLVNYNNNRPLFVTEWPIHLKPFYMKKNGDIVEAFDLLCPNVGEVAGGSLREDNLNLLQKNLNKINLIEKMDWYLDLRRFGNVETGGFGFGFDRFLMVLTGITNIKDVIPYPRWPHNCKM